MLLCAAEFPGGNWLISLLPAVSNNVEISHKSLHFLLSTILSLCILDMMI